MFWAKLWEGHCVWPEVYSHLTSKVPGEGFHDLEVADIQKVLELHAAKLSNEDRLTADNDQ